MPAMAYMKNRSSSSAPTFARDGSDRYSVVKMVRRRRLVFTRRNRRTTRTARSSVKSTPMSPMVAPSTKVTRLMTTTLKSNRFQPEVQYCPHPRPTVFTTTSRMKMTPNTIFAPSSTSPHHAGCVWYRAAITSTFSMMSPMMVNSKLVCMMTWNSFSRHDAAGGTAIMRGRRRVMRSCISIHLRCDGVRKGLASAACFRRLKLSTTTDTKRLSMKKDAMTTKAMK